MTKRWIPFRYTPASWGLVGDAYWEAEAYYHLEGEALERRLLEIRLADDPAQLQRELLEVDERYGRISAYEAARQRVIMSQPEGVDRKLALLAIDYEHGKLSEHEYQKQRAALKQEPWICIVNSGFDPHQGIDGVFFEFDWNQQWIEYLRSHGYTGHTEEQVVDDWFTDVCRSHSQNEPVVPFSILRDT
jgi:hypothetical protein